MTGQIEGFFSAAPRRLEKEIVLPSGRRITILETTGHQEDILKGLGVRKTHEVINEFLRESTKGLDGQTTPPEDAWFDTMLQGDRTVLLIQIRVLSHGSQVSYVLKCAKCGHQEEQSADVQPALDSIKPYPKGQEVLFSVEVEKGAVIHFELPTGNTEKKIGESGRKDANARLSAMRLWEKTPQGDFPVSLRNLKSAHIAELRKKVRELECEIDSTVTLVCKKCGQVHREGLVENPNFLFPNLT